MDTSWVNSGPVSQGCMEGSATKNGRLHIHRAAKRLLSQVGVTKSRKDFPMFVGPQLLPAIFCLTDWVPQIPQSGFRELILKLLLNKQEPGYST